MFPEYTSSSERFNNIGTWIVDVCKAQGVTKVFIEDYSYGSKGRVFHIAENGGVCKFLLWKNNIPYETIPPTVIKKFATGKGNADKEKMQEAFLSETNFNIKEILSMTLDASAPSRKISASALLSSISSSPTAFLASISKSDNRKVSAEAASSSVSAWACFREFEILASSTS
jgi:hypothetical protein